MACFLAAAVLDGIGRSLVTAGEKGVNVVEPALYQADRWRRRNPWLRLLSAFAGLIAAPLMVLLESINLLGFLLKKGGGKLRVSGKSNIRRWAVRRDVMVAGP